MMQEWNGGRLINQKLLYKRWCWTYVRFIIPKILYRSPSAFLQRTRRFVLWDAILWLWMRSVSSGVWRWHKPQSSAMHLKIALYVVNISMLQPYHILPSLTHTHFFRFSFSIGHYIQCISSLPLQRTSMCIWVGWREYIYAVECRDSVIDKHKSELHSVENHF